jgi:diguanylate cyclase (GGDEF)-like protein
VVGVGLAVVSVAGALLRAALAVRDARVAAETAHQAVTDELTGLGNRRLLLRRLDRLLDRPGPGRHALLLLDLDRFKEVNDTLGHPVGDELLRRLGPRLAAGAAAGSTVARLGGDEFGVLLADIPGERAALDVAERLTHALTKPFTVDGLTLHVAASVGIALAPEHGTATATLLRCADVAMYEAKRRRTGPVVYHRGHDRFTRTRLESATSLRRSLAAGDLGCQYQPQLDLATGAVVGVEALARWRHPGRGTLPPAEFLLLAEQTGLMADLTDVVLTTAVADCARWRAAGHPLAVSVNVATTMLIDAGLPDRVAAAVRRAGLPPSALVLEITEETLVTDAERTQATLAALRAAGVGISIDDYGTGYSSLSYLRDLPADELKLDRSFASALPADARARAIVRGTIELAHALGVAVVAEGVEDAGTLELLRRFGCDRAQGHHIAAPMDAGDLPGWLLAHPPTAAGTPEPRNGSPDRARGSTRDGRPAGSGVTLDA